MEGISLDFHCFKALYDAFEVLFFQGFIFTPYQRHWYHLGPCSPDFLKWKLLNNAFKFLATYQVCMCYQIIHILKMYENNWIVSVQEYDCNYV